MTTFDRHTATIQYGESVATVTQLTMKLDRGWAPYVQGSITIPDSLDIDPRRGDRLRVGLLQVFGDSMTAAEVSAAHVGQTAADMADRMQDAPMGSGLHPVPAGELDSPLGSGLYPVPAVEFDSPVGSGLYPVGDLTAADVSALHFTPWNAFGVRSSNARSLDLVVTGVSTGIRDRQTTIRVASDEADAQLYILVQTIPITFGTLSVRAIVSQVLGRLGALILDGLADGDLAQPATWEPGVTAWDFLAPLVQHAGLRLWCDGRRVWRLEDDETDLTAGSVILSSQDRVTDATLGIDLDAGRWADAVVIRYRWRDVEGVEQTRYDVAGKNHPRRGIRLDYDDTPYPGPGAAAQVLRRRQRVGYNAPVEAVSDYSTDPGMAFTLTLDGHPVRTGQVQSVEWRLPDAGMTVEPAALTEGIA